jgi:hypothetical protein
MSKMEENPNTNNRFIIDFFELAFLTEVCLPPSTIARHCFFMNVIDIYYHQMTWEQRKHFYQWIGKKLNVEQEESQIFLARFNPDNQFSVKYKNNNKENEIHAFKLGDKYMVSSNKSVNEKYILSVKKLEI